MSNSFKEGDLVKYNNGQLGYIMQIINENGVETALIGEKDSTNCSIDAKPVTQLEMVQAAE